MDSSRSRDILLCTNEFFSLNRRNRAQQVKQVWLVGRPLPSQVQNEWDETIVCNSSRVVQDLVDSFLGLVRKGDLIVSHYVGNVNAIVFVNNVKLVNFCLAHLPWCTGVPWMKNYQAEKTDSVSEASYFSSKAHKTGLY